MLKQKLLAMVRASVPLAVAITLLAALIYVTAQQVLRQAANDPQIQMAEDTAVLLSNGGGLAEMPPVDVATSLAPYLIIFDDEG